MLGSERCNRCQSLNKALLGLLGDSVHQINADVIKSRLACIVEARLELLKSVDSAKSFKLVCVRALTSDAESIDSQAAKLLEIFVISRCGIALDRKLRILCYLKIAVCRINNAGYTADIKICGSSAADVDRIYRIIAAT